MELKVNLPNPYKVENAEEFFAQMRISIKAAEKTYQQATKNLTEEEIKKANFWIALELTELEATKKNRDILEEIDPEYELRQSISITINHG